MICGRSARWRTRTISLLHVDGARLSNAAAALRLSLAEAAAGADVVSFGGTKNGLLGAEAVVLLNPSLAHDFLYIRKQSMQLASKMRFLAAQFDALLADDLWQRCAGHANAMAARLAAALADVRGVTITRPVQTNAVFAVLPAGGHPVAAARLSVLRVGRVGRRGPVDVLVGHHRGGRGRVRRGGARGGGGRGGLAVAPGH